MISGPTWGPILAPIRVTFRLHFGTRFGPTNPRQSFVFLVFQRTRQALLASVNQKVQFRMRFHAKQWKFIHILISPRGYQKGFVFLMVLHGSTAAPCQDTGPYKGASEIVAKSLPATAGSTFHAHAASSALPGARGGPCRTLVN